MTTRPRLRAAVTLACVHLFSSASQARAEADPLTWSNPIAPYRADPHVYLHTDLTAAEARRLADRWKLERY